MVQGPGMKLPLPLGWNRSRTAALAASVVLHVVIVAWLVMLRFNVPVTAPVEAIPLWMPALPSPPPSPVPIEQLPAPSLTIGPQPMPFLDLDVPAIDGEPNPDWYGDAADVAGAIGSGPERRTFGETPKAPQGRPKEEYPPSIYEKPLPRVGTSYRTPEGEQILWVSDHCYISLGTQSLTMQDFHKAREGIRRCVIYAGKRNPRGDLFDHLKRPPKL
jgi:hypothetical protein